MDNQHDQSGHLTAVSNKPLKQTLVLVIAVMVAEVIGGILSNSLALLGDAGHMLIDALALGLALFAMTVARRPATATRTYGYYRVEIMAALANGITLVLLALWIFYEAYRRFLNPPHVQTPVMLTVAIIGLIANLTGMLLLRRASREQLNIQAAFWHILGDTISSVGVIAAAIAISITGWYLLDPLVAILIGGIILWGAARIVKESVDILLETVPGHVEINQVIELIKKVPGVEDVHDMHIWTITSNVYALSAHLRIEDQTVTQSGDIMSNVNQGLARHFNIRHTTLQLECENCPTGIVCVINPAENQPAQIASDNSMLKK